MEEKERYKYYIETNQLYDSEEDKLYAYNLNNNKIISTLNQQDKKIKDLEIKLAITQKALELACTEELREIGIYNEDLDYKKELSISKQQYLEEAKKFNNEAQKYYEDAYCNDFQNQTAIRASQNSAGDFVNLLNDEIEQLLLNTSRQPTSANNQISKLR